MNISFSNVIIYAREMKKTADFYEKYFGLEAAAEENLIILKTNAGEEKIIIHKAGKATRMGQVCVKLVFSVDDVETFKKIALKKGLTFGATHKGNGYLFANTKDPSKNNVSISSRRSILG